MIYYRGQVVGRGCALGAVRGCTQVSGEGSHTGQRVAEVWLHLNCLDGQTVGKMYLHAVAALQVLMCVPASQCPCGVCGGVCGLQL